MSSITFEAKLLKIKDWTILHLPEEASAQLPSRGMIMVKGHINLPAGRQVPFTTLLEPDGKYGDGKKPSHWFRPDEKLLDDARAKAGDIVQVSLIPTKEWVELNKLNKGMRRPCCFNRNLCSEPYVAHNWVLLEPTQI